MNEATLAYLIMGFGVMVTVLCAWIALKPDDLDDWFRRFWNTSWSMALAVGLRLALGTALLSVAAESRSPLVLTVIGWLAIAGAVSLLVIGKERASKIVRWVLGWPPLIARLWALFGIAFGLFLVWSVN
jgi:hypothetical protein